jgi:N6-adenosine-specific RNA methylase IME4
MTTAAATDLLDNVSGKFGTILADPPWRFMNRTGKVAPEHGRLRRYETMDLADIKNLPVKDLSLERSHLYLWVPNALLPEGLEVMKAWGFKYKGNIVWYKIRKDGGPDGRGVGFYFRNVTEILLFGVRGSMRTLDPGRTQVNIISKQKREHSRKPDEQYDLIESCSPGPFLEMFARAKRNGWSQWGDEIESYPETQLERIQNGKTYKVDSILGKKAPLFEVVEWNGVSKKPRRRILKAA